MEGPTKKEKVLLKKIGKAWGVIKRLPGILWDVVRIKDPLINKIVWISMAVMVIIFIIVNFPVFIRMKDYYFGDKIDYTKKVFRGDTDTRCPYYEPDGYGYRDCLDKLLAEQEDAITSEFNLVLKELRETRNENNEIEINYVIETLIKYGETWNSFRNSKCEFDSIATIFGTAHSIQVTRCMIGEIQAVSRNLDEINMDYYMGIIYETYNSELGFSFQYPDYLSVVHDKTDSERLFIVPKYEVDNEDRPLTAIVISLGEPPEETPLDWMKSKYSGYDISNGYEEFLVDGQKAVSVEDGSWVVFNHPDNKYRVSIALLVDDDGKPLFEEEDLIVSSFIFNLK